MWLQWLWHSCDGIMTSQRYIYHQPKCIISSCTYFLHVLYNMDSKLASFPGPFKQTLEQGYVCRCTTKIMNGHYHGLYKCIVYSHVSWHPALKYISAQLCNWCLEGNSLSLNSYILSVTVVNSLYTLTQLFYLQMQQPWQIGKFSSKILCQCIHKS